MAGANAVFPKDVFRSGILFAMNMGAPNKVEARLTFRWDTETAFLAADVEGEPYDWTEAPASSVPISDIQVPAAVEAGAFSSTDTEAGQFEDTHITVTILGEEWDQVLAHAGGEVPNWILYNEVRYAMSAEPRVIGLFDVDVWILVAARSEVR